MFITFDADIFSFCVIYLMFYFTCFPLSSNRKALCFVVYINPVINTKFIFCLRFLRIYEFVRTY